MTALTVTRPAPMMHDEAIVRDPTWKTTPIGKHAVRWLDTLRWEDTAKNTIDAYAVAVARLALDNTHLTIHDLCETGGGGEAIIRTTLKRWDNNTAATKRLRLSSIRAFFRWAHQEGIIPRDPTENMRAPKRRKPTREAHTQKTLLQLVNEQDSLRDRCCLQLLCRLGLRKNELRLLKIRDIRFDTGDLHVLHGKGGKPRTIPLGALTSLRDDLYFHALAEERQPNEHLLYPRNDRTRPMDDSSVHRWFARCLQNAGLPPMPMHELRHSAADHLYRSTRDLTAVQMLLGHESLGTTQAYLHPTQEDLARALATIEEAWIEGVRS